MADRKLIDFGYTCCVEQGNYGHPARKATWLYAYDTELPALRWGKSKGVRLDEGFHSKAERDAARRICEVRMTALSFACATCRASPGVPCSLPNGESHLQRRRAANPRAEAVYRETPRDVRVKRAEDKREAAKAKRAQTKSRRAVH